MTTATNATKKCFIPIRSTESETGLAKIIATRPDLIDDWTDVIHNESRQEIDVYSVLNKFLGIMVEPPKEMKTANKDITVKVAPWRPAAKDVNTLIDCLPEEDRTSYRQQFELAFQATRNY